MQWLLSVIDNWGVHSHENSKPGTILSSNAICVGLPDKNSKQTSTGNKSKNFKFDYVSKIEVVKQERLPIPEDILVDIKYSGID